MLLMNSSKVYCATNADTLTSVADLGNKGFFLYGLQLNEPETSERIYDSNNEYSKHSLEAADWAYPNEDKYSEMKTRNQESFFLYGRDATNEEIKLNPVNSETCWTNYNAENYLYVRFSQKVSLPSNVTFNDDAMTMNSYKLYDYYKIEDNSTKIDTGIILYRKANSVDNLLTAQWQTLALKEDACIYVEAPAYVEISVLYELRERKGIWSNYSHCIAHYCVWVTTR